MRGPSGEPQRASVHEERSDELCVCAWGIKLWIIIPFTDSKPLNIIYSKMDSGLSVYSN
jgi:hypothetical protein